MRYVLYYGPSVMIFIGLQVFSSVPLTFWLFYSWLLLVPLIDGLVIKRKTWRETLNWICFHKPHHSIKIGLISGIIAFISIFGGVAVLHDWIINKEKAISLLERWGITDKGIIVMVLVLVVINPILEETYWRGYMHTKIVERKGLRRAIFITAFFYSLYHLLSLVPIFEWPVNFLFVVPVFIAGLFWGWMRHKYNTMIGTMVSHSLADIGIVCVYFFFIR